MFAVVFTLFQSLQLKARLSPIGEHWNRSAGRWSGGEGGEEDLELHIGGVEEGNGGGCREA